MVCKLSALRGEADMRDRVTSTSSVAIDPNRSFGSQFCCAAQRLGVKVTLTLGRLRETARHSKPETHETAAARRRGRSATTRRLLLHCRVALESQFDVVPQPP